MTDIEIVDEIINQLNYFKFNRNSLGYEYLIDAILIVYKKKISIKDFNVFVYPKIAKKYETKSQNILWCITKLINLMYVNTDEEIINQYFHLHYGEKLSPKAFIMYISRNVANNIENKVGNLV